MQAFLRRCQLVICLNFGKKIPAGTGTNVTFIDRVDGFKKAITIIDAALTTIAANPVSTSFAANVPAGINIANTLNALKARYSLYAGLYPQALAAAQLYRFHQNLLNFDAQLSLNPVFEVATRYK